MAIQVDNKLHFGHSIFQTELPDFDQHKTPLLEAVDALRKRDQGIDRSNQGGWHSHDQLQSESDPAFQWLIEQLYNIGSNCIRHAEGQQLTGDVLLSSAWVNVNPYGAWNAPHMHLPCEWSGVCYLSVNENPQQRGHGARDGDIMFFDPQPFGAQYGRPPTVSYSPKNGGIFIFPGYLLHMVAPHLEQEDRISVAFNFRLEQNMQATGI